MSRLLLLASLALTTQANALELTERQVKLDRELSISGASKAAEDLFKLDAAGQEPIVLIISTRSGFLPAAMVLVDAIAATRSPVYAVVQPEAFGVGAVVAAFCEKRYAFANATLLFNKFEYEAEKVMKESPPLPLAAAEAYVTRVYGLVAKRLGLSEADFRKKAEAGWFLTAEDAKSAGLVTEIVDKVSWVELVIETVEVKRVATLKGKQPALSVDDVTAPKRSGGSK